MDGGCDVSISEDNGLRQSVESPENESGAQSGAPDDQRASFRPDDPALQYSDVMALANALAALDDAERAAVVEHVLRLVKLSPAKRAAMMMLTGE